MRRVVILVLGVVALLGVGCGKSDKDAVQGTSTVESLEADGKAAPAEETKQQKFVFTADKFTIIEDTRKEEKSYKIDPNPTPKTIDVTETREFGVVGVEPATTKIVTQTMKGIYSLEGDTLKRCFGRPNTDRPTEFLGTKGQALLVLKRAK